MKRLILILVLPLVLFGGLSDSLVAYYNLSNSDDSYGSQDGTNNGCTFITGKYGNCADFTASEDDYIDLPDNSTNFTKGISISCWVKVRTVYNYARFIELTQGTNDDNIILTNNVRTQDVLWSIRQGSSEQSLISDGGLMLSVWQHLVSTIDENGNAVIWLNGRKIKTGSVHLPSNVTRDDCFIGKSVYVSDDYYDGAIDELCYWNRDIDSLEVDSLYNDYKGMFWNGSSFVEGTELPTYTLKDSLQSWWSLKDTCLDNYGSQDGTNFGAVFSDSFATFNPNSYISIPDNDSIDIEDGMFSISIWFEPDTTKSTLMLIFGDEYNSNSGVLLQMNNTSLVYYYRLDYIDKTIGSITKDTKYHLVFSNDQNGVQCWLNNTKVLSNSPSHFRNNSQDWKFGRHDDLSGTRYYDGKIWDTGIWKRSLNETEVDSLYNGWVPFAETDTFKIDWNGIDLDLIDTWNGIDIDLIQSINGINLK